MALIMSDGALELKSGTRVGETIGLGDGKLIIGFGTFLECLEYLRDGKCDAIFGPVGGTLVLRKEGDVNFVEYYMYDQAGISFGVDTYLSIWRCIKFVNGG